jgi:hypothetical protein
MRRADGEYRWLLIRVVPLRHQQGHIVQWYGTSTDIEDRNRARAPGSLCPEARIAGPTTGVGLPS